MERRFLIKGVPYDDEWQDFHISHTITESELKRRCEIVASILSGHSPGIRGWNEARDILVNGEEKVEVAHWSSKEMVVDPTRCVCGKPYGHLSACALDQPDPWEEWIEKMPVQFPEKYHNDMKDWFRQMPRR